MSAAENKAVVRRFFDTIASTGNVDDLDSIIGPGYANHGFDSSVPPMNADAAKPMARAFHAAFPDSQITIEYQVAEGDLVATRYVYTATHCGEFMGIPATNKKITVPGTSLHRVVDGQIVEDWPGMDTLGMLQQLGAIPQATPAGA